MCGICGVWYTDGREVAAAELIGMAQRLAHRGPDGQGTYTDGSLGLGHRRLAILDLSTAGHQPMPYAGERYWISYNGEIYNFLELRGELEMKGHSFRSDSDTEVILAAYAEWGPDCLLRFNGMWAFAIWDRQERMLFLARDRFGIKPLFFLQQDARFAFASEMKAFLALPGYHPEVNWPVFKAELLDMHSQEGGEQTLLQHVRRLRPGHYAIVRDGEVQTMRWWYTLDHLQAVPARFEDQVSEFRALFDDACRLRMRSDVTIGTSLSGGLDSSSVVATVAHVARQGATRLPADWQRTFSATFPGSDVDEARYAQAVVAQARVQATYREIRPEDAQAQIERSVYHLEQLEVAPLSQLLLLYECQRAHGVVVTLDGHGGDELLAGYPGYVVSALYDEGAPLGSPRRYLDLLHIYRDMFGRMADTGPRQETTALAWDTSAWLRNSRTLARRVGMQLGPRAAPVRASSSLAWLSGDFAALTPATPTPAHPVSSGSLFQRHLYRDFHEAVLPVILRNYDRLSMAHGVEVRMPLMDWRLVTYAFALPPSSLLGHGYSKRILREAMRGRVPDVVLQRRDKVGFASPVSTWIQGSWRPWLLDVLHDPAFRTNGLWDGAAIARHVESQANWNWQTWSEVWRYVHAYLWLRCFTPNAQRS